MGPSRIERYVLGRNLWAVGATLVIMAWVVVLLEFVEVSSNLGSGPGTGFAASMGLALLKSPTTILTLLPFCFLFGAVWAFVALNRSSELVAMRAAGVSAWRFIFPTAIAAFLVGLWSVTVASPMASSLNARYQTGNSILAGGAATPKATWLRQEDGRNVIYIEATSCTASASAVGLGSVTMLVYAKQPGGALNFSRQILAKRAELSGGAWRLTDATENTPGAAAMHSDSLSLPSTLDETAACERFATPEAVSFWRLPALIDQTEKVGLSATVYKLRLQQLLATPLLFSAMTVLAAAFSLRLVRLGNLGLMAAAGVAIGFAVFFLAQLCGALGKAEALSPALAAWAPPLAALLVGFTLLCFTEDG